MFYKLNRPTALSLAAIGLCLSAVGPWITVFGVLSLGPDNSTELAIVVFGGIALLIASALSGRFMRSISILVGLAILGEALNTFVRLSLHHDELDGLVTTGWGLYLSILIGLFLVASSWIIKQK